MARQVTVDYTVGGSSELGIRLDPATFGHIMTALSWAAIERDTPEKVAKSFRAIRAALNEASANAVNSDSGMATATIEGAQ